MSKKIKTSFQLGGIMIDVVTEDELSQVPKRCVTLVMHLDSKRPMALGFTQDDADTLIAALQTGRKRRSK